MVNLGSPNSIQDENKLNSFRYEDTACIKNDQMHFEDHSRASQSLEHSDLFGNSTKDEKSDEASSFLCSIKKLFSSRKKHVSNLAPVVGIGNSCIEEGEICRTAIETFTALLSNEHSHLPSLVGKELKLSTSVSVHAIVEGSQPNIILRGTIPFRIATPSGIKKKKVHVMGKLYNSRADLSSSKSSQYSANQSENSMRSVSLLKEDSLFRLGHSSSEVVEWEDVERYTLEQYYHKFFGILGFRDMHSKEKLNSGREIQKFDSFIEGKGKENETLFPLSTINLTRVRMRNSNYNDGSEVIEKLGKKKIKIKIPRGIFYKANKDSKLLEIIDCKDSSSSDSRNECVGMGMYRSKCLQRTKGSTLEPCFVRDTKNMEDKHCSEYPPLENAFTQDTFFCVKRDDKASYKRRRRRKPKSLKTLSKEINMKSRDMKSLLKNQIYLPLPQRNDCDGVGVYCPLTWLYNSYGKTKTFIHGFLINEGDPLINK